MILSYQSLNAVICRTAGIRIFQTSGLMISLSHKELLIHLIRRLHRISEHLEECCSKLRIHLFEHSFTLVRNHLVICKTLLRRAILERIIGIMEVVVGRDRIPLTLVSHILRLTVPRKAIICIQNGLETALMLFAKDRSKPLRLICIRIFVCKCIEVPCHIHEHLDTEFHRLDVTDIEQPIAVCTCVIRLFQL